MTARYPTRPDRIGPPWLRRCTAFAAAGTLAAMLAGCSEPSANPTQATAPVDVSVITVKPQARAILRELPGRIAPLRIADVRARVSGIIMERLFQQGSEVKAGDPLYRIDPSLFQLDLESQKAALAKAEAVHDEAVLKARRVSSLAAQKAVSQAENESATATLKQAEAEVAARHADVNRAQLALDNATIRAPINGLVGAALVSEGALVVQHDTTSLASIQQIDRVYADFTQPVSELSRLRRALDSGDLDLIAPDAVKVRLVLDDGTVYPQAGKLLFSEAKVDANTGQVTLRGEFINPRRELLPGMYVRVRVEQGIDPDAIAVPQQAVQRNGSGDAEVYVVKPDNKVTLQPIRTGALQEGQWLVLAGLKPDDKVVVEGFQKIAPGDSVTPQVWNDRSFAEAPFK